MRSHASMANTRAHSLGETDAISLQQFIHDPEDAGTRQLQRIADFKLLRPADRIVNHCCGDLQRPAALRAIVPVSDLIKALAHLRAIRGGKVEALEMEQHPQLETRIADGDFISLLATLLQDALKISDVTWLGPVVPIDAKPELVAELRVVFSPKFIESLQDVARR